MRELTIRESAAWISSIIEKWLSRSRMWVERGECEYGKCDDCGGNGDSRWKDNFLEKGGNRKRRGFGKFFSVRRGRGQSKLVVTTAKPFLIWFFSTVPVSLYVCCLDCYLTLPVITCSKLAVETLEQGIKCSKLTIKTPERRHWHRSGVVIVNLEHISHLVLLFLLITLSR